MKASRRKPWTGCVRENSENVPEKNAEDSCILRLHFFLKSSNIENVYFLRQRRHFNERKYDPEQRFYLYRR